MNDPQQNGASGFEGDASQPVDGLVMGTPSSPASPLAFSVFVHDDRLMQLDDVVHVRCALPTGAADQYVDYFGIVDEVNSAHEGVQLDSDVSLIAGGYLVARSRNIAHVGVTRIEPEYYLPPRPGTDVRRATGELRDRALFFDQMENRVPLGLSRTGEPVYGNVAFLDGTRGAHVNISGISGVATKTSWTLWLLASLFGSGALAAQQGNTRALVFNVKGEDLLWLDKKNVNLSDRARAEYELLGIPSEPFRNVSFCAPVDRMAPPMPATGSRKEDVRAFYWTVREFCEGGYLRFLFAEDDDARTQIGMVAESVASELRSAAYLSRRSGLDSVSIGGVEVGDFDALVAAIVDQTHPDSGTWGKRAALNTVSAFLRRLEAAQPHVGHLIRSHVGRDADSHVIDTERANVTVIDLHKLHDRAQRFVVGVVLKTEFERKERVGTALPLTFVVLDELNKYAPRDARSPIKDVLLDIAERGRSLGIILIGAQQTASEVEPRVVSNCAFRVVGRLDVAESQRSEYGFLTSSTRARAGLLKPGTMIVSQPEIPVPLIVRFPFPAWATRAQEAALPADPFAVFETADI